MPRNVAQDWTWGGRGTREAGVGVVVVIKYTVVIAINMLFGV